MILLDAKAESSAKTSSPLSLSSKEEKTTISFSELLKGIKPEKDEKLIQNGALVLSLSDKKKELKATPKQVNKETLVSLLKNDEEPLAKTNLPVEINPKITENLAPKELKILIADAKEYLKDKILQSDGYKKAQVKDLPKTLKGLAQMAQKFGIDVSKITVEEVQLKQSSKNLPLEVKEQPKVALKEEVKAQVKDEPKVQAQVKEEGKPQIKDEPKVQAQVQVKEELKPQLKDEPKVQAQVQVKEELKPQVKDESKAQAQVQVKEEVKAQIKDDTKKDLSPLEPKKVEPQVKELKQKKSSEIDDKNRTVTQAEDKKVQSETSTVLKQTPLFKAQVQDKVEYTTQQLVASKQIKPKVKTQASRADETLKLLLQGEKAVQKNPALTADFSVATARVIAPSAPSETAKTLENLLHGENQESTNSSKLDGLNTHKADSFEVKLNEAKQMIKYLSSDVKTAIEDYKSPFTRVKVQLNPQRLGEVDVTIVQRGKNLHVNISSNNNAINTLSTNSNELRAQLNNNGINNATLNFNNSSQSEGQNSQQQRNNQQDAHQEYNYFENEEHNEEIISSLEIVVPNYA